MPTTKETQTPLKQMHFCENNIKQTTQEARAGREYIVTRYENNRLGMYTATLFCCTALMASIEFGMAHSAPQPAFFSKAVKTLAGVNLFVLYKIFTENHALVAYDENPLLQP